MKSFKPLFIAVVLFSIFSCKKDSTTTSPKTKTELLTAKTWVYDEYFTSYNSSNTTLAYKKGKANNSLNLSLATVKFNADLTYTETTPAGSTLNGTWKFLNSETQTQTINTSGTFTSNIILLSDNSYMWLDPIANNGTYAKMIPQ